MSEINYIHVCPVCDYVHEDNDDTPFDELSSDYLCPACGVDKDYFEKRVV